MSQIKPTLAILSMVAILGLAGCGDKNSQAVFPHPTTNWQTDHKTAGKANLESCFGCHGEELDGGIANVSCTSCHIGNAANIHPTQWGSYAYARHSSYVGVNGTTSCANAACHGTELTGVTGSGPSCTSCHLGGISAKHPAVWLAYSSHGNYASINGLSGCSNTACHGSNLKGVFLSGTSCYKCHVSIDAATTGLFKKHPETWGSAPAYLGHQAYKQTHTNFTCRNEACHPKTQSIDSWLPNKGCGQCHGTN